LWEVWQTMTYGTFYNRLECIKACPVANSCTSPLKSHTSIRLCRSPRLSSFFWEVTTQFSSVLLLPSLFVVLCLQLGRYLTRLLGR